MRATVYPILLTLSSLGVISITNGQDGRCSLTCRDQPNTSGAGWQLFRRGEALGQLVDDAAASSAAGPVYRSFGGNVTATVRGGNPSEAPDSRLFIGHRNYLRVCSNSCSATQISKEKSTLQRLGSREGLNEFPSSKSANGIPGVEPKPAAKSGSQTAKKAFVAKRGHDKSARVIHKKM